MTVLPVRQQRDAHRRRRPRSPSLNGSNIISVASALQSASPSVIPMITIGGVDVGTAPGAARPAARRQRRRRCRSVQLGGLARRWSALEGDGRAAVQGALRCVRPAQPRANRSTHEVRVPDRVERGAVPRYEPRREAADHARRTSTGYGIDGTTRANVRDIGRALIVAVKAFKMGLTNSVVAAGHARRSARRVRRRLGDDGPADAQEGVRRLHGRPQEHGRRQHRQGPRGRHRDDDRWRHDEEPAAARWLARWHPEQLEHRSGCTARVT